MESRLIKLDNAAVELLLGPIWPALEKAGVHQLGTSIESEASTLIGSFCTSGNIEATINNLNDIVRSELIKLGLGINDIRWVHEEPADEQ